MAFYSKKDLIEKLGVEGMSGLNDTDGSIQTTDADIATFKSELGEACMMTLEEYSPGAERIYNFLFK